MKPKFNHEPTWYQNYDFALRSYLGVATYSPYAITRRNADPGQPWTYAPIRRRQNNELACVLRNRRVESAP